MSRLGDSVYRVALVWWVLQKTGSAAAMAKIFIFSYAPMLLFLMVGGVVVDRFSRSKAMLVSDISRASLPGDMIRKIRTAFPTVEIL